MDNYNYPLGADTPDAPWNQPGDPDPLEVEVTVSTTLSKDTSVWTTDYIAESWEDWDTGDEGEVIHTGGTTYDYSDVNFEKEYLDEHYSLEELLTKVANYALEQATRCLKKIKDKNYERGTAAYNEIMKQHNEWIRVHNSSVGWVEDETEVVQN